MNDRIVWRATRVTLRADYAYTKRRIEQSVLDRFLEDLHLQLAGAIG